MGLEGLGMRMIRAMKGEIEVKVEKGACVSLGTEQGAPDKVIRNQI